MGDSFAHLHVHTEYSMLDGAARIDEVVAAAVADGQPAIGITDHGNMYGVLDFYSAARKAGITPVIGTEAYMAGESRFERPVRRGRVDDTGGEIGEGEKLYYHLTLLAESNQGYKNLMKLSSSAYLEGYYYKPRCLVPGQEIVTGNGVTAIEDVRTGDLVLTHRGRLRRVTQTMSRPFAGKLYGVRLNNRYGRVTWMTGEHPVLVRDQYGTKRWVEVQQIAAGRSSKCVQFSSWQSFACLPKLRADEPINRISTADHLDGGWRPIPGDRWIKSSKRSQQGPTNHYSSLLHEITLDYDFGFLIGLYAAEGHVDRGTSVTISLHQDETHLVDAFARSVKFLTGKEVTVKYRPDRPGYRGVSVTAYSAPLARFLAAVCGTGARSKRLPAFTFEANDEFQRGVLDGVLAGDGAAHPGVTIFTQTSRDLAWQVRMLAATLTDSFSGIAERWDGDANHGPQYCSNISTGGTAVYRRTCSDDDYVYRPITEILERDWEGTVYNIEVDEDHSYVSDFAIHNCDWELLERHHEGVIATTGCLGGVVNQALLRDDVPLATKLTSRLSDIFGPGGLYVEIQDHGMPEQHRTNRHLIEIARDLNLPLLATNDSHYVHQEDSVAHDALLCVQTGAQVDDPKRFKFHSDQHYLKTAAEMRALFAEVPESCDSTLEVAERASVEIEFGKPELPNFPLPAGFETEDGYLRHLALQGAHERYGAPLPADAAERIDKELTVIEEMGLSAYFLIVWDLINYARTRGIRVGPGRGSAAGCCVAYCLKIVDLDPLKYGLIFERFLNAGRKEMPDIDMDFDERYRGDMIKYAAEKYGSDHVAQIVTFSTIKARAAVRDAARVLGYPYAVGDRIAKAMPPLIMGRDTPLAACLELTAGMEEGYKMAADLREIYDTDPDAKKVIEVARGLAGLRRQDGIHAAAVVITRHPLTEYLPIQRKPGPDGNIANAPIVTQYEMHGVSDLGLLKMDFLGLRNLSVIEKALDLIEVTTGERVDIDHVPLDDEKTFEMLRRGDSIGVFQLEGGPMRALIRSLAPTCFDDIGALVALYRPGPMAANMHNDFADRKNGRKPITYIHPDLGEVLGDTQGLMIYQESLMRVAQRFAGYSLQEADNLRKACLPAGTLMLTKSRGYVPIEQVMSLRDRRAQTIDTTSCNTRHELVDDVWSVGVKPVYELTTSTGYSIRATAEHPFLVEGHWRELAEIAPGDLVGVAARTATHGGSRVSTAEIEMAALLISEGYTPDVRREHKTAFFCNTDPELVSTFLGAYERFFGRSHAGAIECNGVTRVNLRKAELLSLLPVLGRLGLSAGKVICRSLVNAPRHKVERFLGLYFCADGWADGSGMHFASKSKDVCRGLKRMLLRCGIVSNLCRRVIAGDDHWTLSVADKAQAKAFVRVVEPHLTERKAAKVGRWLAEWSDGSSATNIGIPSSFLRTELARRQAVTGKSKRRLGVDTGGYVGSRVLHRETLNGLLYSERLEDLRTGDLVWDTVISVQYIGELECFDFRMANEERPYAVIEDFLVHNCGKKIRALMAAERDKFVAACEKTGYGAQLGTALFDVIEPFADYAFPKAHAYCYGMVAYQTAWLKANHPVEYLAALLTSVKDDKDKTAVYLSECRTMGVEVMVPDINKSMSDFVAVEGKIPFGLSAIRNVGEGLVGLIVAERDENGPYADFYDFCLRVSPTVLNKRSVESLIKAGAFDSLGHPRRGLLMVFEQVIDRTLARRRERDMGIMSLFGEMEEGPGSALDERMPIPDLEFDPSERLTHEKEMLGLYVSSHPLLGVESALRRHTDCSINELRELRDGEMRWVGGVVTGLSRKYTKRGDLMATFTLEDLQSAIEVMVFPRTMLDFGAYLADDAVVCVKGRIDTREEPAKIICMELKRPDLSPEHSRPVRIKLDPHVLTPKCLAQLKEVLREHPGSQPVLVHLDSTILRLPDEFRVDAGNGLVAELRELLGANGLVA